MKNETLAFLFHTISIKMKLCTCHCMCDWVFEDHYECVFILRTIGKQTVYNLVCFLERI